MPPTPSSRLPSIDLLRGLVIILMALDHARDYFAPFPHAPEDLSQSSPSLFLTRWITHFCAPVFVFLAGTSIYLRQFSTKPNAVPPSQPGPPGLLGAISPQSTDQSNTLGPPHRITPQSCRDSVARLQLPHFLLTRGLFLIALELTLIAASWGFLFVGIVTLQVIWALGASMLAMSVLVRFPWQLSLAFGLALITLHNLLDSIASSTLSAPLSFFWIILHEQNFISLNPSASTPFTPPGIFVVYPLIPWVGVMALGYAFGRLFFRRPSPPLPRAGEVSARLCDADGEGCCVPDLPHLPTRACILLASLAILTFLLLRATNLYGDPSSFSSNSPHPILSFLNTTKYPPSLHFLLMTLGPALLLLPLLPKLPRPITTILSTFGRVPLFFYLLHIPLLHIASAILWYVAYGVMTGWQVSRDTWPDAYMPQLWIAYAAWLGALLILWLPCRWFMRLRQRRKDWWLSYL